MATEEKKHIWQFYRYGGLDQVELETAEDLTKLNELDPKRWAAMTCPVSNVDYDSQTLAYLDTDGDKRIKIPEIIAGVNWISSILKDPASIRKPEEDLPLDKINENSEEGKALLSTAKQVLFNLGKEDSKSISLADLASTQKIFAATAFNGDGVITPDTIYEFNGTPSENVKKMLDLVGDDLEDFNVAVRVSGSTAGIQ